MSPLLSRWELAAEAIAVKIRWFGLLVGYLLVNVGDARRRTGRPQRHPRPRRRLRAARHRATASAAGSSSAAGPLLISAMEALFIGLLCYFDAGARQPVPLLLPPVAHLLRHPPPAAASPTPPAALHCVSYLAARTSRLPPSAQKPLPLRADAGHARLGDVGQQRRWRLLLKRVGDHLGRLNAALESTRPQLEARIAERTRELQEAQAHVLHQEKMAAFGLLAAGIAHEVGNPLTSISSLVQMLQRRDADDYTREKLGLVGGQLQRIQATLRELVNFSRPASTERTPRRRRATSSTRR